jgi:hypothetical protein
MEVQGHCKQRHLHQHLCQRPWQMFLALLLGPAAAAVTLTAAVAVAAVRVAVATAGLPVVSAVAAATWMLAEESSSRFFQPLTEQEKLGLLADLLLLQLVLVLEIVVLLLLLLW